jgi:hypothetical protein
MTHRRSNRIALGQPGVRVVIVFLVTLLVLLRHPQQPQQQQQQQQQQQSTLLSLSQFGVTVVQALPSGAAGCAGGTAAAFGFHQDYGPGSTSGRVGDVGTLAEFNTTFTIEDIPMVTSNITVFRGGRELKWVVVPDPDLPLRGILLRVQPLDADTEFTLTGDSNLKEATVCFAENGNVEGITHQTRVLKNRAEGTMRFDNNGIVNIDMTIVYLNGRIAPGDLSVYAYTGYIIEIRNTPAISPVPAPVAPPPTNSPVENRCATNTCRAGLGLSGRLYNRFRGGQCRERCAAFSFFALSLFGWQCGGCF